jgi:hypothetical protein
MKLSDFIYLILALRKKITNQFLNIFQCLIRSFGYDLWIVVKIYFVFSDRSRASPIGHLVPIDPNTSLTIHRDLFIFL